MSRYLTVEHEKKIQNDLRVLYPTANKERNNGLDIDVVPYLKRLNAIDGVATLQSCAGHNVGDYIESAHLWIWLSEELAQRLYLDAPLLAQNKNMEAVQIYFVGEPPIQEIIQIIFRGNPYSMLPEACEHITAFFEVYAS